ncbi:MAG TPA: hypothetical protein VGA99_10730 [bacterium]
MKNGLGTFVIRQVLQLSSSLSVLTTELFFHPTPRQGVVTWKWANSKDKNIWSFGPAKSAVKIMKRHNFLARQKNCAHLVHL